MADIVLVTARLIVRRWVPDDLQLWLDHLNTPEATAHLGGLRTTEQVAEKFETLLAAWDKDGFSFLAVALKDCGTFLGTCGIARIATDEAPDELRGAIQIGWQLRADSWGQGYAPEAAQAFCQWAFGERGIPILYSQTSPANRASWRVMEKLGMARRADLDYVDPRFGPEDNPTIIYALSATDWAAQQAA